MTKTRMGFLAAVAAVAVAIGAVAVRAQGPGHPGMGPMRGEHFGGPFGGPLAGLHMALRSLNLTDDQKTQVKGILDQHKSEFQALMDRGATARKALEDAVATDPVNDQAVRDASAGVAAVQADAAVLAAHVRAQVFQVLTPEQQQKAKELRAQADQRFEQMRQRRRSGVQ